MPELDDQIRSWVDRAAPITPDEVRRAAEGPTERTDRRPRVHLLVAAALVLVVGVAALALGRGDDDGDRIRTTNVPSTSDAPSTTTSSEPVNPAPTTTEPSSPSTRGRPPLYVAHTTDHTLVVVDSETGEVLRTLVEFDDPDAPVAEGEPAGMGRYLAAMDLAPDGETVFYETCCEPAAGEIWRVPIAGGEPERIAFGTHPAVSPDGTELAIVELQGVTVIDLSGGDAERRQVPIAGDPPAIVANPAWSPDGTMLAFEHYATSTDDGSVMVVTFDDRGVPVGPAEVVVEAGGGEGSAVPMFPSFDAEGNLHVVRQDRSLAEGPLSPGGSAEAEVYDPIEGTLLEGEALAMAVRSSSFSPDGSERLIVWSDGVAVTGTLLDRGFDQLSVLGAAW